MKGKLKKWLKENGKNSLGTVLDKIGENTSIPIASGIIESIGESLMDDPELTPEQKKEIAQLVNEELKLVNEDRANARGMNIEIQKAEKASWMAKNTAYVLDYFIALSFVSLLFYAIKNSVPAGSVRDLVMISMGVLGNQLAQVINFHRGTSQGSKDKSDLLNKK